MKAIIDNINYNAYLYQQSVMSQFEEICAPLFQLGIESFDYFKVFEDGRYLRLIRNLEYSKRYLLDIKDNGVFFTEHMNTAQEGRNHYFLIDNIKIFDKQKDPILHMLYDFNIFNSLSIYRKNNYTLECYAFQAGRENTKFPLFCLNNLNLLEHFCEYFNDRAKDIIAFSDQKNLACFDQQFNFHNTCKEDLHAQQIQHFLQETQIKKRDLQTGEKQFFSSIETMNSLKYLALGKSVNEISSDLEIPPQLIDKLFQNFKGLVKEETHIRPNSELHSLQQSLSPRQKECLFWLTRGKTAKQIGRILDIDHRTVETHMISLKNKLDCNTKEQLIEKAFESGFAYSAPQSLIEKQRNHIK